MRIKALIKYSFRLTLLALVVVLTANIWMWWRTEDQVFTDLDELPKNDVGLVLGTSPRTRKGNPNEHFNSRIKAAANLYKLGKIRHVLVSGDNRKNDYNEPRYMQQALMKLGVPKAAITLDYAGIRTLDSVVRAHKIFDLTRFTIISQCYHNYRAVYLANTLIPVEVVAWCSPTVPFSFRQRVIPREWLARVNALVDVHIRDRQPRIGGEKLPINVNKVNMVDPNP